MKWSMVPWRKKTKAGNGGGHLATARETHPLAQLRHEFETLFDRLWGEMPTPYREGRELGWAWDFDLHDEQDKLVVRAEAPGFEADDFDVQVSGNLLTIKGQRKEESRDKTGTHYRYGTFRRVITLPQGIDPDKVDARYHSGVLEVHVPKAEQARGKRIEVKQD